MGVFFKRWFVSMKCIVYTGFGNDRLPIEVAEIEIKAIREKDELFRLDTELISAIESLPWEKMTQKEVRGLSNIDGRYISIVSDDNSCVKYIFPDRDNHLKSNTVSICDVDTTRKWGIEEYDGAESIVYFEDLEPLSIELNFYRRKFD